MFFLLKGGKQRFVRGSYGQTIISSRRPKVARLKSCLSIFRGAALTYRNMSEFEAHKFSIAHDSISLAGESFTTSLYFVE